MSELKIQSIASNLKSLDISKTVTFYEKLGFKFTIGVVKTAKGKVPKIVTKVDQLEDGEQLQFAKLDNGGGSLLFDEVGNTFDPNLKVGGSFMLFSMIENDIKTFFEFVKKGKFCEIVKELHTTFYGKEEFYVKDPVNGYVIGFAKDVEKKNPISQ